MKGGYSRGPRELKFEKKTWPESGKNLDFIPS